MEALAHTCVKYYDITAIPVSCRLDHGETLFRFPAWTSDLSKPYLDQLLKLKNTSQPNRQCPLILSAGQSYMLAVIPLPRNVCLIFGPVNISTTQSLPPQMFESLTNLPPIVHMSYSKFLNAVLLLTQLCTGKSYDPAELLPVDSSPIAAAEIPEEYSQVGAGEKIKVNFNLHPGETYEQNFLMAIERGDTNALLTTLKTTVDFSIDQMSFDPVQQQKYLFVMFMTMAERAAIRGGLPAGEAFAISHEYCRRMDRSKDVQRITILLLKMAEELCEGVKKHSKRIKYSNVVRVCCDYIDSHLYSAISLENLANTAGLCERSISQRFRNEVGMSPLGYIHSERIRVARYLLRYTSYTILDISSLLQFSSQSHFTKVFREHEGVTPRKYRLLKE
ncbi:MAG: helix-turn-helix transcriptional regulator [Anaerolineaceae bacterium]|jgi:AraC-like DNA-binding protein